ncbi:MAG: tetraacyldisaccharide 4'-kinase [Actinobacteria bacterium]|nr:tetraacyldisaccharide 4'-kinase [Actinomycetota bacterium]
MNQSYPAIITGLRRGLFAGLARVFLSLLSLPYALFIWLRNILYDHKVLRSYRADVPIVCVGNIACGGTGKTPTVIALVRMLQASGHKPAVLTRGYKGSDEIPADEVLVFNRALPDIPIIVGADRVASAQRVLGDHHHDIDVLVMDDGFGHRRLARDLDIVLLAEPLENVRLLPRGLYREPVLSLSRADIVLKTYDSQCAVRQPTGLLGLAGPLQLSELQNRKVLAFCGIGNPVSFENTLTQAGAELTAKKRYPDHHRYLQSDLDELADIAARADCSLAVTTMKDFVKIQYHSLSWPKKSNCQLAALDIEMSFSEQTETMLAHRLAALFAD